MSRYQKDGATYSYGPVIFMPLCPTVVDLPEADETVGFGQSDSFRIRRYISSTFGGGGKSLPFSQVKTEARPRNREVQHLAGEYAYRIAQWPDAVKYFQRGGTIPDDRPLRQFYYAVSLYETGDRTRAATVLRAVLPRIKRTAYVEDYVRRVLGDVPPTPGM